MVQRSKSEAQQIRASLKHPVIDADGHWLEFGPIIVEQLRKIRRQPRRRGISRVQRPGVEAAAPPRRKSASASAARRKHSGRCRRRTLAIARPRFCRGCSTNASTNSEWISPCCIRPPGWACRFIPMTKRGARRAARSTRFIAELFRRIFRSHDARRGDPDAYARGSCRGARVRGEGTRAQSRDDGEHGAPPDSGRPKMPNGATRRRWFDMLGLDSEYNYDPVWAKCVELGISPTFHSGSRGVGLRNVADQFRLQPHRAFRRGERGGMQGDFLGRRDAPVSATQDGFPRRRSRMGMRALLRSDRSLEEAQSRGARGNESRQPEPRELDETGRRSMAASGSRARSSRRRAASRRFSSRDQSRATSAAFASSTIMPRARSSERRTSAICSSNNFYFGCEADDPLNAYAFNRKANPYGAKMNVLFGSDIGHFDVPDMKDVVPEAYELVEDELITEDDFRDFMFINPVRFWGEANPNFSRARASRRRPPRCSRATPLVSLSDFPRTRAWRRRRMRAREPDLFCRDGPERRYA